MKTKFIQVPIKNSVKELDFNDNRSGSVPNRHLTPKIMNKVSCKSIIKISFVYIMLVYKLFIKTRVVPDADLAGYPAIFAGYRISG